MPENPARTIRIYCDFDGTVTREDIGDRFFERFSGPEMWEDNALYRNGDITAEELYRRNAARIEGMHPDKIEAFCREVELIPSFQPFVQWAAQRGYPLEIVSDGFDIYIDPIFAVARISVPYTANRLTVSEDGTVEVAFPYSFPDCTCSANCKRNRVLLNSGDEDLVVYIGDGFSDFCPAQYADVVFAKGDLERYCQQNNVTYRRFFTFDDVITLLEKIESKKRWPRSSHAALLRKQVWLSG